MKQLTLFEIPKPPDVPPDILRRYRIRVTKKKDAETIFMEAMTAIKPLEKRYIETHAGDFCYEADPPVIEDIDAFLFYGENLAMYEGRKADYRKG
jgi:hypothetical protein